MLEVIITNPFERSARKMSRRGKDGRKLEWVIEQLEYEKALPVKYKDHKLIGNYSGHRECHIEPDWLLVYKIKNDKLILVDTGSHSDLF